MKRYKLIKLLAKLENEYEKLPDTEGIKKERIFKRYTSLFKKYQRGDYN